LGISAQGDCCIAPIWGYRKLRAHEEADCTAERRGLKVMSPLQLVCGGRFFLGMPSLQVAFVIPKLFCRLARKDGARPTLSIH